MGYEAVSECWVLWDGVASCSCNLFRFALKFDIQVILLLHHRWNNNKSSGYEVTRLESPYSPPAQSLLYRWHSINILECMNK